MTEAGIGLDHVVVAVADWDRSNAFYRDVLGAEVVVPGGSDLCFTWPGTPVEAVAHLRRHASRWRPAR